MRVVAALCWFDEPADFLERAVTSLAGVADVLVAVDGPWRLHPNRGNPGGAGQQQLVRAAAAAAGIESLIVAHLTEWPSQVAKRDWMMRSAGDAGDWVLVIDGDEYLDPCDAGAVREQLAQTDADVAAVTLRSMNRPWPLRALSPMTARTRRLYRAGTTVPGPTHNDYTRGGVALNGDQGRVRLAPALDLTNELAIAHDNRNRPAGREQAAQEYRRARRLHQVEVAA